jgi:hypothetical protein
MLRFGLMCDRRELDSYAAFTIRAVDRTVACLDGLTEREADWQPAPEASSLRMLAVHSMANAEENIVAVFAGEQVRRRRDAEFTTRDALPEILSRWRGLRKKLGQMLEAASPDELGRPRTHPRRGTLLGREVLLVAATHAAEHMAHAELTRQLISTRSAEPSPDEESTASV